MPTDRAQPADRTALAEQGFLVCPGFLDASTLARVRGWVEELAAWPAGAGEWLRVSTVGRFQGRSVENTR